MGKWNIIPFDIVVDAESSASPIRNDRVTKLAEADPKCSRAPVRKIGELANILGRRSLFAAAIIDSWNRTFVISPDNV
jgi:hypothetical protein